MTEINQAYPSFSKVLDQSLKSFLHLPQYVKKVEELIQAVVIRQVVD